MKRELVMSFFKNYTCAGCKKFGPCWQTGGKYVCIFDEITTNKNENTRKNIRRNRTTKFTEY